MKFWKNCIFQVYSVENIKLINLLLVKEEAPILYPKCFYFKKHI